MADGYAAGGEASGWGVRFLKQSNLKTFLILRRLSKLKKVETFSDYFIRVTVFHFLFRNFQNFTGTHQAMDD